MKKEHGNPWVKKGVEALTVAFFGLILLSLAFLFDFLFQMLMRYLIEVFVPLGPEMEVPWFPPLMHLLFAALIILISWLVFRSKLKVIYKASYMAVPVAVVLVTVGMLLFPWPAAVYSLGALLCMGTLYFFRRTKQPWLYYYSVILMSAVLAIFTLVRGEI